MLAVAIASTGQTPAARTARAEPPPMLTARIAGVVTAADTRGALARVRVVLTSDRLSLPRVTLTDAGGRYAFDRLPRGIYQMTFSRSGFLTRQFDAAIDLAERQQMDAVNVALERGRVIEGRILDEDATPLAGARVQALRPTIEQGTRTFASFATATSDDLGRFRLTGLLGGTYLVAAHDPAFERAGDDRGAITYPPTFYPGVSTADAAVAVRAELSPNEHPIEFLLRLVRPVKVSGRLISHDRKPLLNAAVIMSPQLETRLLGPSVGQADIRPDGVFTFGNVPPGHYVIRARGETERDGPSLFATFTVGVQARDVGQIEMTLTPGATVQGQLAIESRHGFSPPALRPLRVRAPMADGSAFGDTLTGTLGSSGAFRLSGLIAGSHLFMIEGLTFPWCLTEARVQGRNVADTGFDVDGSQEYRNVRLLLTDTAAGVSGVVSVPAGTMLADVLVVVFPADPLKRAVPLRFIRTGRVAANGTYRIIDLVPGEYRIAAVPGLTETDALNPAKLAPLVDASTPVALREAQIASVPLQAVQPRSPESVP